MLVYFLSILLLISMETPCNGAKILSIGVAASESHKITYEPLLFALGERGHNVTILSHSSSRTAQQERKNIHIKLLNDGTDIFSKLNLSDMYDPNSDAGFFWIEKIEQVCEDFYDSVQEIIHENEKFDLVITEGIAPECEAGLIYKLNTSFIFVTPRVVPSHRASKMGSPFPPSLVNSPVRNYFPARTNFQQRVENFLYTAAAHAVLDLSITPRLEEIYRRKLNDSTIPASAEILRNVSLLLSCSHFSIGQPLPFLPDIIEVGGMHLVPPKPLPEDLSTFIGEDDFIYFSFGSLLKGIDMPEKQKSIFIRVFSQLKLKVLWKLEIDNGNGTMQDLPPNIRISKWFPQQDVLGHPSCKLFITHGGFGGVTEAIYHQVPMLGMPFYGDQPINLMRASEGGYAIITNFFELSEDKLFDSINHIINGGFMKNVQRASTIFRDQLTNPLDRAIFWTEYVLRHKGAVHLRSPARDLSFLQYHSLDVIAFLLGVFFGIFTLCYKIIMLFFTASPTVQKEKSN